MPKAQPGCAASCPSSEAAPCRACSPIACARPRPRLGDCSPDGGARSVLELIDLCKQFGGVKAVDCVNLRVETGEIFGLIGPNGSGKSTIVNLIAGLLLPTSGRVVLANEDVTELPSHRRVARGIARTFQNIRLFGQLTVWQNLWVAENRDRQQHASPVLPRWLWCCEADRERIGAALEFSGLAGKRDDLAAHLSFREQRRLELARALAAEPRLLLLDEPAAGM